MGQNIISKLTEGAFSSGDNELEREIQKIIVTTLGQNSGQYEYQEFSQSTGSGESLTVVGEDRYRKDPSAGTELVGTYEKKTKGELADKWLLADMDITLDPTVNTLLDKPTISASSTVIGQYNSDVRFAIQEFTNALQDRLVGADGVSNLPFMLIIF